jgi:hypothetical protein
MIIHLIFVQHKEGLKIHRIRLNEPQRKDILFMKKGVQGAVLLCY